jgi:hypothetical protein
MRRRSRRSPNTSESTGKIGQELPSNQPAPLVPFYPDDRPAAASRRRSTGLRNGLQTRRSLGLPHRAAAKAGEASQAGME